MAAEGPGDCPRPGSSGGGTAKPGSGVAARVFRAQALTAKHGRPRAHAWAGARSARVRDRVGMYVAHERCFWLWATRQAGHAAGCAPVIVFVVLTLFCGAADSACMPHFVYQVSRWRGGRGRGGGVPGGQHTSCGAAGRRS